MAERTLTLSSAGKMFSFTGWKIGWATGPRELTGALLGAKQWLSFSSGSALQPAVAHALDNESGFYESLRVDLQGRRAQLCAGLSALEMGVLVPEAPYFACTDVAAYGWKEAPEFCLALPEDRKSVGKGKGVSVLGNA